MWEVGRLVPTKEVWMATLEERHGKEVQAKFSSATVSVCGLGGLGSNIAISLARAGIGRLVLVDFDRVDIANLHRQQYKTTQIGRYKTEALVENIREIAPYIELEQCVVRIDEGNVEKLLQEADIICEALDDAAAKAMLVNTVLVAFPDKYIVAASGMAGLGSANTIKIRRVMKRLYICGDEVSAVDDGMGLVSSRAMLCAAHQAHTVLRILANKFET